MVGPGSRFGAKCSGELLGEPGGALLAAPLAGHHLGAAADHALRRRLALLDDGLADVVGPDQPAVDDVVLLGDDEPGDQRVELADVARVHVVDLDDRVGDLTGGAALEVGARLGRRLHGAVEPLAVDLLLAHVAASFR